MSRRFLTPVNLPKGNSLPLSGTAGDLFFKLDEQKIYVHNGTDWAVAQGGGSSTTVSATPPSNPNEGDTWFNSSNAKSYVYYDGTWVDVSVGSVGPAGPTGPTGAEGPVGPTGPAGEGVTAMSLLTDVQLTDLLDGDVLLYNQASSTWVNRSLLTILAELGAITSIDAGLYNTTMLVGTLDGGSNDTTEFVATYDGGNEGSF